MDRVRFEAISRAIGQRRAERSADQRADSRRRIDSVDAALVWAGRVANPQREELPVVSPEIDAGDGVSPRSPVSATLDWITAGFVVSKRMRAPAGVTAKAMAGTSRRSSVRSDGTKLRTARADGLRRLMEHCFRLSRQGIERKNCDAVEGPTLGLRITGGFGVNRGYSHSTPCCLMYK